MPADGRRTSPGRTPPGIVGAGRRRTSSRRKPRRADSHRAPPESEAASPDASGRPPCPRTEWASSPHRTGRPTNAQGFPEPAAAGIRCPEGCRVPRKPPPEPRRRHRPRRTGSRHNPPGCAGSPPQFSASGHRTAGHPKDSPAPTPHATTAPRTGNHPASHNRKPPQPHPPRSTAVQRPPATEPASPKDSPNRQVPVRPGSPAMGPPSRRLSSRWVEHRRSEGRRCRCGAGASRPFP